MALPTVRADASRMTAVWAIVLTIASLYFAYDVLMPIALAVLLAFLLAPIVHRLERRGVTTVVAVLLTVGLAAGVIAAIAYTVGVQSYALVQDLPNHKTQIEDKVKTVSGFGRRIGARFGEFGNELNKVAEEPAQVTAQPTAGQTGVVGTIVDDPKRAITEEVIPAPPARASAPAGQTPRNPIYAVVLPAPLSPVETLKSYGPTVVGALGTAGLVLVFVIFVLLERTALRDRLIRLISNGKYTITTRAINDAATRISRYVLAQSIVNGTYGITIAIGLYVIGLTVGHGQSFPSFVLWGLLCAVLRFVPYIGPWVASLFPAAVALAVYDGFGVFGAVVALFVVIELISNNVMEPWLYGASTGLSTVAILVAACFWTWLWGPIGLVLSTPLTVCIVVMGRYIGPLAFLEVLLSDRPALPPSVSFYQRLLAGDATNAAGVASAIAADRGWAAAADEVVVPAIALARRDRANDDLTAAGEAKLLAETHAMIDRVARTATPVAGVVGDAAAVARPVVVGYPAHHRSEEIALELLGLGDALATLSLEHATTRQLPSDLEARLTRDAPLALVIAVVPPGGLIQARYLCRRLHRRFPNLKIVVAFLGRSRDFDKLLVRFRAAGAAYVTTSIAQTQTQLLALHAADRAASTASAAPIASAASTAKSLPPVAVDGPKFV